MTVWADVVPVLLSITGLAAFDDAGSPERYALSNTFVNSSNQAKIVIRSISSEEQGTDRRYSDNAEETVVSWCAVTVQILCENYCETDAHNAQNFLTDVRTRFNRTANLEQLDAVGAHLAEMSTITRAQLVDHNRELDTMSFDIVLNCEFTDTDASTAGSWIQIIGLAGNIRDNVFDHPFGETVTTEVELS